MHEIAAQTYDERKAKLSAEAMNKRLETDAKKCTEFKTEIEGVEKHIVKSANVGRELGLSFQEYWLPSERAAAVNFFNKNYKPKLRISYEAFCWLITTSKRLPNKCRTVEDVWPAIQLTFFAGNLIEVPTRPNAQMSHETSPVQVFFTNFTSVQNGLKKVVANVTVWDSEIKAGVKEQIEKFEAWLDEIKLSL